MFKKRIRHSLLSAVLIGLCLSQAAQAEPRRPECIAPSKPGGGFDLTCKILQMGLKDTGLMKANMRATYMPGGVGAVAFNTINAHRRAEPGTLVAFGSGSMLNLLQGRFGKYTEKDARWLASVGVDYGLFAVRGDSKYKNLDDVVAALREDPASVVIGISGSPGNPHWMKTALFAREIGVDPRKMRFVSFEGNVEALTNMLGGHFDVLSNDVSAIVSHLDSDDLRVLGVLSKERLPGKYNKLPTAAEQGYDIDWSVIRGVYLGPDVTDEDYQWWNETIQNLYKTERYAELRDQFGFFPLELSGAELQKELDAQISQYRQLSEEFGFIQQ